MNSHEAPPTPPQSEIRDCFENLAHRAKRRLSSPGPADLAGAAIAGVALGYLLFSRRRPRGIREAFLGSVVPFARQHAHDTLEAITHHKQLEPLRRKMSKVRTPW